MRKPDQVHKFLATEDGNDHKNTVVLKYHQDELAELDNLLENWPGVASWNDWPTEVTGVIND